jgi:hypothetical protein
MAHFTMPYLPVVKMRGTVSELVQQGALGALTRAYNAISSDKRHDQDRSNRSRYLPGSRQLPPRR